MKLFKLILTALLLLFSISSFAQQGINYKALIKDGSGNVVANQNITVQFIIYKGVALTNNVYQETHTPTTDANGIIIINIGTGATSDDFSTIGWGSDTHHLNVQINTGSGLTNMGTTPFMAVPYALNALNAATKIDDLTDGKSDTNGSSLFLGIDAGLNNNGTGNQNIGIGFEALKSNTTGYQNTANGFQALNSNTTGNFNTANGSFTLNYNTIGSFNTANGIFALYNNTTGNYNTANGALALYLNTTGYQNTANGYRALYNNTTGYQNTANGYKVLQSNTTGFDNTANGHNALYTNITGLRNTAIGKGAGYRSLGDGNIFMGYQSGSNETASNKLYIENTNANADNALIYGEFGADNTTANNILRTNSEFQIGNPTGTGYAFPTVDGSANQILQTDGNGGLGWSNSVQNINDLADGKSDGNGSSLFLGVDAGLNDDGTDNFNVGIGFEALKSNTTGNFNTANGYQALNYNTTGNANTANGYKTLYRNTTGFENTANGYQALNYNTTGNQNTANGLNALRNNTTGFENTANGYQALYDNTTGDKNTAIGKEAGYNSLGDSNIFMGYHSGYNETTSNKLYIENTNANANNALIYGEFGADNTTANNILRTNSEFQIGNPTGTGYAFPTVDGSANQILQTDGNGGLGWSNISDSTVQNINDLADGKSDTNGSSLFLGIDAGLNDDGTDNKNIGIGFEALKSNTTGVENTANGYQALFNNTTGFRNTTNGAYALNRNTTGYQNTANGHNALYNNTTGYNNTANGYQALYRNTTGNKNTANGSQALYNNTTGYQNTANGSATLNKNTEGFDNTANGHNALYNNITGLRNTAIGKEAGYRSLGDSNIFMGYQSGYNETTSNKLYIENTNANADNALIYGEFGADNTTANNILRTNSEFQIGNPTGTGYAFPTVDGSANQILQTDGNGGLGWLNISDSTVQNINDLADGKSDTNGSSLFLGVNAGLNDDGTDNKNIGIGFEALKRNTTGIRNIANGYRALYSNTTGNDNTANGHNALYYNTTGYNNTANGYQALYLNTTGLRNTAIGKGAGYSSLGDGNIFMGYQSGAFEATTSNKLYIENTNANADNALIYGEFGTDNTTANNILRTNSEFQIGNPTGTGYAFPTVDGSANQILQTDGNGGLGWSNSVQNINDLADGKSDSNGSSIFLGVDAGLNDDGTNNKNIGIGFEALKSNTTGDENTANGYQALYNNTTGDNNTANGGKALYYNTTGEENTANGYQALYRNTTGYSNTANGNRALYLNTTGNFNTANGNGALRNNTTGYQNTANGIYALYSNTTGSNNTANGLQALYNNTTGLRNTAIGKDAGYNSLGDSNIFMGYQSGYNETTSNKLYIENTNANADNALIYGEFGADNTTANNILRTNSEFQIGNPTGTGYAFPTVDGSANQILQTDGNGGLGWLNISEVTGQTINNLADGKSDSNGSSIFLGVNAGLNDNGTDNKNTAIGFEALKSNIAGYWNTANGYQALNSNTTGFLNTANGAYALYLNTTGLYNTANGSDALYNTTGDQNSANGFQALYNNSTGDRNTANGFQALYNNTTGNNNTAIGHTAQVPNATGSNQVRIGNTSVTYAGVQVAWAVTSDRRWKDNIRELPYGLDFVKQLQPVDYIRKNNDDKTRETGFIAQDVAALLTKVGYTDQGLLTKDDAGYMSVRYNDFIAILTKAMQEQQDIIESQQAEINNLQALVGSQQTEVKTLTSELATSKEAQNAFNKRLLQIEESLNTAQQ